MGDVSGKDLLHLQCHFGMDTLGWTRRGARVTGLDFSAPAVEAATKLASELRLDASFVRANVYDAEETLDGRTFDIVYAGLGAINWLPDIGRWAGVVETLVRPGGFLYLAEFHPFSWVFGDEDLTLAHDYFHDAPRRGTSPVPTPIPTPKRSTTAPTSGTTLWATWSARWPGPVSVSSSCTSTITLSFPDGRFWRSPVPAPTGCPRVRPTCRSCTRCAPPNRVSANRVSAAHWRYGSGRGRTGPRPSMRDRTVSRPRESGC